MYIFPCRSCAECVCIACKVGDPHATVYERHGNMYIVNGIGHHAFVPLKYICIAFASEVMNKCLTPSRNACQYHTDTITKTMNKIRIFHVLHLNRILYVDDM